MKKILISSWLCTMILISSYGQTDTIQFKIDSLANELIEVKSQIADFKTIITKLNQRINDLSYQVKNNKEKQSLINDSIINTFRTNASQVNLELESTNQAVSNVKNESNIGISSLSDRISTNTVYWVISISFAVFLSIILFILLRRSFLLGSKQTFDKLQETRKIVEEESVKIDNKLIELLEKQLNLNKHTESPISEGEVDHSLALKVADEIVRIQKNLSMMEDGTKGKKQLLASVERIRANFEANGYEIVDMLNKPYDEGMKVQANFRPDESLETGQQIITRIIKPQVNFSGVMIQSAQIEVSQGQ